MEIIYGIIGLMFGIAHTYDYLCNEFESPVKRISTTLGIAFICVFPLTFLLWPILFMLWLLNILRK
jgi:hypothetical protein